MPLRERRAEGNLLLSATSTHDALATLKRAEKKKTKSVEKNGRTTEVRASGYEHLPFVQRKVVGKSLWCVGVTTAGATLAFLCGWFSLQRPIALKGAPALTKKSVSSWQETQSRRSSFSIFSDRNVLCIDGTVCVCGNGTCAEKMTHRVRCCRVLCLRVPVLSACISLKRAGTGTGTGNEKCFPEDRCRQENF